MRPEIFVREIKHKNLMSDLKDRYIELKLLFGTFLRTEPEVYYDAENNIWNVRVKNVDLDDIDDIEEILGSFEYTLFYKGYRVENGDVVFVFRMVDSKIYNKKVSLRNKGGD